MKDCAILSIVLQLLFDCIDDSCFRKTNVFDNLWFAITHDGLNAISEYSNYIVKDVMNEKMSKKQSALFQALREYYHPIVFSLLKQSNIADEQNFYDLALNSVVEHGWVEGITSIREKIKPMSSYMALLQNIQFFLRQETTPSCVKVNSTPFVDIHSESTFNDRHKEQGNHYIRI